MAEATVHVRGYTRKDGTYVAPYTRSSPGSSSGGYSPSSSSVNSTEPQATSPVQSYAATPRYDPSTAEADTAYGSPAPTLPVFPALELKTGSTLRNVRVISTAARYLMARWDGGSGTIQYADMPTSALEAVFPQMQKTQAGAVADAELPAATTPPPAQNTTPPALAPTATAPTVVLREDSPPRSSAISFPWREIIGILAAILAVVGLAVGIGKYSEAQERKRKEAAEAYTNAARQFVARVTQQGGLRPVGSSLMLKKDEHPFLCERVKLYETRAVRQGSMVGFRVVKGVWVGQSTSHSTQEMSFIDDGTLTVTNQRLVFDGGQTSRSVALEKILSVHPSLDAAEISAEGRQKSMVLTVSNGLILGAIIEICRQAENPMRLSGPLDITFGGT